MASFAIVSASYLDCNFSYTALVVVLLGTALRGTSFKLKTILASAFL